MQVFIKIFSKIQNLSNMVLREYIKSTTLLFLVFILFKRKCTMDNLVDSFRHTRTENVLNLTSTGFILK